MEKITVKHHEPIQGDIKCSKASVALAEKEIDFVAKNNVLDDLS